MQMLTYQSVSLTLCTPMILSFLFHFFNFTLRESPITRCDSLLYFKGIMHRKHKRMLFHVNTICCFREPNIVNPRINHLDLKRPNTISTG